MRIFSKYRHRITTLLLGGYGVILAVLLFIRFNHWAYDDPFITYRYAENIANGVGFVYNQGERVLSTTSPLFALILGFLKIISSDIPTTARAIGVVSIVFGAFFLWDLGCTWKNRLVGAIGLFIYPIFPLLLTTIGSETPLYLALCLGAIAAYARGKYSWVSVLIGMATLARPDAILVAAVLSVHFLIKIRRPIPWDAIALFLAPLMIWALFSWGYFGSVLPVTLTAKQHQGSMAISTKFFSGLLLMVKGYGKSWPYYGVGAFALIGVIFGVFRRSKWLLIVFWTGLYLLAYTLLGVSKYFWYYAPLVPGLIVSLGLGFEALWLGFETLQRKGILRSSAVFWIGSFSLFTLFYGTIGFDAWKTSYNNDSRFQIYKSVGQWLHDSLGSGDTIGTLEVGIIGYYSRLPIIDFAGLIQPAVADKMKANSDYQETAFWAIDAYHPKYVVAIEQGFPQLEEDYLSKKCRIVKKFQGTEYQFRSNMEIYECGS